MNQRYSSIPWSILSDPLLKPVDVRVYGVFAAVAFVRKCNVVKLSIRELATHAFATPRTVVCAVERLVLRSHLEVIKCGKGQATHYKLVAKHFESPTVILSDEVGVRETTRIKLEELRRKHNKNTKRAATA